MADLEAEIEELPVDQDSEDSAAVATPDAAPTSDDEASVPVASHNQVLTVDERTPILTRDEEDLRPRRHLSDEDMNDNDLNRVTTETSASSSHLNLGEATSPSISPSPSSQADHATVQPVNIASRKATSGASGDTTSQLEQSLDTSRRTPSPHNVHSPHPLSGVEGPMTPTNDAGPFVLDGSGKSGRGLQRIVHLGSAAGTSVSQPADGNVGAAL